MFCVQFTQPFGLLGIFLFKIVDLGIFLLDLLSHLSKLIVFFDISIWKPEAFERFFEVVDLLHISFLLARIRLDDLLQVKTFGTLGRNGFTD